jgi:solute carrier family 25 S-adenosylmethionine transporter 26
MRDNSDRSQSQSLQVTVNFISGAIGLSTAFAIMHPLDSLKTQLQAKQALSRSKIFSTLSRGFTASVLGAGPQGGLRLATYEYTKSMLSQKGTCSKRSNPSFLSICTISAASAIVGDLVSSIVKVPREVITSRLQVGADSTALALNNRSSPSWITFKEILKENGYAGLFRGFWSTTLRDCPFMITLFTTYEAFKLNSSLLTPSYFHSDEAGSLSTVQSILFGGVSGCFAGLLTVPFDVYI